MHASSGTGGVRDASRRWREAEEALYPAVLSDPEAFERCVDAVRAVAAELADCRTTAELLARDQARESLLASARAAVGTGAGGPVPGMVVGAAFALRHRRVRRDERAATVRRRLDDARAGGIAGWVTLWSEGADGDPPAPPFERLEVHLPGGAGLHRRVTVDPDTCAPRYWVAAVRVDPATGAVVPGAAVPDPRGDPTTGPVVPDPATATGDAGHATPEGWRRAVEALRASCAQATAPAGAGDPS